MQYNTNMKKMVILLAVFTALTLQVNATKHTVAISGFTYSPALLSAHIGDTITINATGSHPLVQVSKATWNSSEAIVLAGGWGTKTSNYTFTVSSADTIYYVCSAHVSFGMKGRVVIAPSAGINEFSADQLSVAVYPNPMTSTGTVKLSSSGTNPVSVYVFSINGQLEKDLSSTPTNLNGEYYYQFDAGTMPSGNHFIMVSDSRNKIVKKFEVIR
ncbi:MAG: T9SS C-terminal target domain-containing protein [Porphyromonadaceae bacterium]|nr:MAG: T9SS C-terminal target domain-containing protein [Porphyromonadaceae bacterium]